MIPEPKTSLRVNQEKLPDADLPVWEWIQKHFPHVATAKPAQRHIDLWDWVERLKPGICPKAFIAIWPRGGGKSTSVELACARVCATLSRRCMLIVSETQEQADKRVQAIASLLERLGVERAVNQYGTSKGWKRQELRTANGFNVAAFGLDTGARGVKLDEFRPDIMVFDDVDGRHDTPKTTQKKIDTITETLIPAGSADCAVMFVQNRIIEFGVMSQLADGTAEFLLDREPISEEPAIIGLQYEPFTDETGLNKYRITAGTPTWEGQSLETCQRDLWKTGLKSFLREKQHEVSGADGVFFQVNALKTILPDDVPPLVKVALSADTAATEGGGDYTAIGAIGVDGAGREYILPVIRGQWGAEKVSQVLQLACKHYLSRYRNASFVLPEDPGAAGKRMAAQDRKDFAQWHPKIQSVTGSKATRAEDFAKAVNLGNVYLVCEDVPKQFSGYCEAMTWRQWHMHLKNEMKQFREDEKHDHDDQVDMLSDGHNELQSKRERRVIG